MANEEHLIRIENKLDNLYKRLFEDNGGASLQTRVDRNTMWIASVKWLWCVIATAVVGVLAWLFKK